MVNILTRGSVGDRRDISSLLNELSECNHTSSATCTSYFPVHSLEFRQIENPQLKMELWGVYSQ